MEYDHPIQAPDQLRLYTRMGEIAYSKMRGAQAWAAMRADPGHFAGNTLKRVFFFWGGVPHPASATPWVEYARSLNFVFASVCGLLGLALALWRKAPGCRLTGVGLLPIAAGLLRSGRPCPLSSPAGTIDGRSRSVPIPIRGTLTKTGEKRKIEWFGTVCVPQITCADMASSGRFAHPHSLGFEHIQQSSILPSNFVTPVWQSIWRFYVRGDPHRW